MLMLAMPMNAGIVVHVITDKNYLLAAKLYCEINRLKSRIPAPPYGAELMHHKLVVPSAYLDRLDAPLIAANIRTNL